MRLRKPRERETHFVVAANVKTRRKKRGSHVEGSLQVWIYAKLYPVGVPW
jgi:hypothetical protein